MAIYDANDNMLMRFEYADSRLPVAMQSGGATYYLAYDQVGSLRIVTDASGNVIKTLDYDSFGNIIQDTNPGFDMPFGFAGGLHDPDTGLVRFGFREYSPEIGRWMAKDPILFMGGDADLYGYCLNDPINLNDPDGLINVTKTGVGLANMARGVYAGAQGATVLILSAVAIGSGEGAPVGALGLGFAIYQFGIAFPGLTNRGLKQFGEGLNEDSGELSFGHWANLLGLGPLGADVDDPCETYKTALNKKKDQIKNIANKALNRPIEAIKELLDWLRDWAM